MSIVGLENHRQKLMADHRSLDKKITDLFKKHYASDTEITTLKKQKLALKQEIVNLEEQINESEVEEI